MIFLKQVNLLINKELIFDCELKRYELFHKEYRIIQYFNYYKYGHMARMCCKEKKCEIYTISGHNNQNYHF